MVRTAVSSLKIAEEAGPRGPVIRLAGEADLTVASQLRDAITAQVCGGARCVTIDLSALRFTDSAAVDVFVGAHRALRDTGGVLELLNPQPGVARVLGLLGVDRVVPVRFGRPAAEGSA